MAMKTCVADVNRNHGMSGLDLLADEIVSEQLTR